MVKHVLSRVHLGVWLALLKKPIVGFENVFATPRPPWGGARTPSFAAYT